MGVIYDWFKKLVKRTEENIDYSPKKEELKIPKLVKDLEDFDNVIPFLNSHNKLICPDCKAYLLKDVQRLIYFCPMCGFHITYEQIQESKYIRRKG